MNLMTLAAQSVIVLTVCTLVLAACALLSRLLSEQAQAGITHRRAGMLALLGQFRSGRSDAGTVLRALRRDRSTGRNALFSAANTLAASERGSLFPLFAQLRIDRQEYAALAGGSWLGRVRAANHLALLGTPQAVPPLLHALNDPMLDVRLAAAQSLGRVGATRAVVPILHALALPGPWALQRASEVLVEMGPPCIPALVNFVKDPASQQQVCELTVAVRVLGMLPARNCASLVAPFLRSKDTELRVSTAKALGRIGDKASTSILCAALEDPVWNVRSAAAQALGRLLDPAALPELARRLNDSAWWVRYNAAQALFRHGEAGGNLLKATLREHNDSFARDISRQTLEEHGRIGLLAGTPS